jgi:hypothetical protein
VKAKIISSLVIAITAALVTRPVLADLHQLIITENSATDLSATYDGSPLTVIPPIGQLSFTVVPPSGVRFEPLIFPPEIENIAFIEPEDPTFVNWISFGSGDLSIISDFSSSLLLANIDPKKILFVSDGATVAGVGIDLNDTTAIALTFHDNAGAAEAPETGSTLALLFLSLIAFVSVNRRFLRLANEKETRLVSSALTGLSLLRETED